MTDRRRSPVADGIDFAVLGIGGIGRWALTASDHKEDLTPVAACDRGGVAIDHDGLDTAELLDASEGDADVTASAQGEAAATPVDDIVAESDAIDAVLITLPSLEHDAVSRVVDRFVDAGFEGVLVDVLHRSRIDTLDEYERAFVEAGITFVRGGGATPGFLTGAAALAAQSFVDVEAVEIWWGVGRKSDYEDTPDAVREDIAYLDGYDIETAQELTEDEIEAIVDERDGVLELTDMDRPDGLLLERAGVCNAENVTVGGILDVRRNEKPTTTTVSVTGRTFDGDRGTNTFEVDDATSMAANVNGPALGYLKSAVRRNTAGTYGVLSPVELMPEL